MRRRRAWKNVGHIALHVVPSIGLVAVLALVFSKVFFRAPEFDEAQVLHASWLIANVGKMWIDVFEHHSPLFNTINSWIFNTNSDFFALHAKSFALCTYLLGTYFFALSSYRWLGVAPTLRVPYLLFASIFYIILTWPVDIGVVRPENYAMLALMTGSLLAFHTSQSRLFKSYAFAAASAFFMALAVSFSPRSIVLVTALGIAVLWALRARRDWLRIGLAACVGGIFAALLNLSIAPFSGFYKWIVDFNSHMRPLLRDYSAAADAAVVVTIISLAVAGLWLFAKTPPGVFRGFGPRARDTVLSIVAGPAYRRLFFAQAVLIVCWIYLFFDSHWGRQSFGGIAVAAAVYVAVLIAFIFTLSEAIDVRMDWATRSISALPRRPRAALIVFIVAAGGGFTYLTIDKIHRMTSRLQLSGMLADISLMQSERPFRLQRPNDLLPLSEAKNLGEWLLWSKRYCAMLHDDYGLASPHRHPVCIKDPTYYWYLGVHLRAMEKDRVGFQPNPPFNPAADILEKKPAFIDTAFLGSSILPNTEVEAMLKAEYILIESNLIGEWAWLRRDFLERHRTGSTDKRRASDLETRRLP